MSVRLEMVSTQLDVVIYRAGPEVGGAILAIRLLSMLANRAVLEVEILAGDLLLMLGRRFGLN